MLAAELEDNRVAGGNHRDGHGACYGHDGLRDVHHDVRRDALHDQTDNVRNLTLKTPHLDSLFNVLNRFQKPTCVAHLISY